MMSNLSRVRAARGGGEAKLTRFGLAVGVGGVGAVIAACSPTSESAAGYTATFQGASTVAEGDVAKPTPILDHTDAPTPATGTTAVAVPSKQAPANNSFKKGARFDANCVVAWPSAPIRTSNEIEMTMSCAGVPQQYLFVEVVYGDPKLPITPDTGSVEVQGKVVDIATSEMGFQELVVQADHVTIH